MKTKKILSLLFVVLLVSTLALAGCSQQKKVANNNNVKQEEKVADKKVETGTKKETATKENDLKLVNGTYRGSYGDEVIARFVVADNKIESMTFASLQHNGTNYKELKEGDKLYPILQQHNQILEYVKGKTVSEVIKALEKPGDFVKNIDTFSGATVRASKIKSAMADAVNRGVYTPANVADVPLNNNKYADGAYRGYFEGQATVWFNLKDNTFSKLTYRELSHGGNNYLEFKEGDKLYPLVKQYEQILAHLDGKKVSALNDLYTPGNFVNNIDTFSGATVRASKVLSSINDGLNRGPYKPDGEFKGTIGEYKDGTYRGYFAEQVVVQFSLEKNNIKDVKLRKLFYNGTDFNAIKEGDPLYPIVKQHQQLVKYLDGKPLSTIFDLYQPKNFINDVDTYSGATLRTSKVLSAIVDGLNRGTY